MPNPERYYSEDAQSYKKGYEVRLVVSSKRKLAEVRSCLRLAGFPIAKSFTKHSKYVQPVYGLEAVEWFTKPTKPTKAKPSKY